MSAQLAQPEGRHPDRGADVGGGPQGNELEGVGHLDIELVRGDTHLGAGGHHRHPPAAHTRQPLRESCESYTDWC